MRVVGVDPVHGPDEVGPAAVEVAGGPAGGPDRDAHPLGQADGPGLQRGDDPDREGLLPGQEEPGPPADDDRVAGPADRLDELGQVVEVGLLRGVMLLAEGQDPVLDDARGQLVEGADLVGRPAPSGWAIASSSSWSKTFQSSRVPTIRPIVPAPEPASRLMQTLRNRATGLGGPAGSVGLGDPAEQPARERTRPAPRAGPARARRPSAIGSGEAMRRVPGRASGRAARRPDPDAISPV